MRNLLKIVCVAVAAAAVFFMFIFVQIVRTGGIDNAVKSDAIVILGAAEYAGKPSPVFAARLEQGLKLFEKGLAPIIITTGGIADGEKYSEGEVGKKFLENRGVPAEKIIAEEESLTTKQNLSRVKDIATERNIRTVVLVSDPFHMYRAKIIAERLGLDAKTSPTHESPISKNFWLEFGFIAKEVLAVAAHIVFDI